MYALAYWKGNSLHLRGRLKRIRRSTCIWKKERQFCIRRPASARGHAPAEFCVVRSPHHAGPGTGDSEGPSVAALCVAGAPPSTRIRRPMGNAARWKRPWRQRNGSGVRVGTRSFCHRPRLQLGSLHLKTGTTTRPTPPAHAP